MSRRNQWRKRRRYYRGNAMMQDHFAKSLGLEICGYTGHCDFCDWPRPAAPSWARMSYGEVTEMVECVCSDCLPGYFQRNVALVSAWGYSDRNCRRMDRVMQRQRNAARRRN